MLVKTAQPGPYGVTPSGHKYATYEYNDTTIVLEINDKGCVAALMSLDDFYSEEYEGNAEKWAEEKIADWLETIRLNQEWLDSQEGNLSRYCAYTSESLIKERKNWLNISD